MSKAKDIRNIVLGGLVAVSGLSALAAVNLTTFAPGTPIKSSEVNANFTSLKAMIEEPVGVSRLVVNGKAADGKVLKLENGNLAWGDDLTGGSGGAAYSAGTGLALTGTTFSLADGGITKEKFSATGAADGKVLKIHNGALAWGDDIAGSGGSTYSADGSSLQLSGTTFSVKDGGIGTGKIADGAISNAKLANGAVTANKLSLPLSFTVNSGAELVYLKNASGSGLAAISGGSGFGVYGESVSSPGLFGRSQTAFGVDGRSTQGEGVRGMSVNGVGVLGQSENGAGLEGVSKTRDGVRGTSQGGYSGVFGQSASGPGVQGWANNAPALIGRNGGDAETLQLIQTGNGALIDAHSGPNGVTVFSVDKNGNVYSATNSYRSDRNAKTNFQHVDTLAVLEKVAAMPMTRWNYKHDPENVQHIGPMAQDFHAAFRLNGSDDTRINTVDVQGVSLAAIKGLYQKNLTLEVQVKWLESRLAAFERQFASVKAIQSKPSSATVRR